eukprot:scaffold2062_cov181-Ochromonas_danica.AAC.6
MVSKKLVYIARNNSTSSLLLALLSLRTANDDMECDVWGLWTQGSRQPARGGTGGEEGRNQLQHSTGWTEGESL